MKKTLVILPGWGGSHETWGEFIALAEKEFQVVCIDLPCFGDEPCPSTVWGVEEYAAFAYKKIQSISSQPVFLLGHSFGGQVAAYIGATYPECIEKLILVGAAALRPKQTVRRAFFFVIAKCGKLLFRLPIIEKFDVLAKKILYRGIDSPDYGEIAGIKRDIFRKIIRTDLGRLLSRISAPTLLLWGKHDSYVSLALGKKMHRLIPGSELVVIENGKHGLHLTHREQVLNFIRLFREKK